MMKLEGSTPIKIYAASLTALLAGTLLLGNRPIDRTSGDANFKQITVERINLVEPDGTLRMVISNEKRLPGIIRHGRERAHSERKAAGMLFYNNEGTEAGGLIFGGRREANGTISQGLNLTFDQYDQDQTVQLTHQDNGGKRVSGLVLADRPDTPIPYDLVALPQGPERDRALAEAERKGLFGRQRLVIAKNADRSFISLRDANGRPRLTLRVTASGEAAIEFLDAEGRVQNRLVPAPAP